ncbi:MAG: BrnT family toxin [Halioglobus sp.]
MDFEYDECESLANLEKHGMDFVDTQALWSDPDLLEIQARTDDEPRYLAIGVIDSKHWSAVFTYCGEIVRVISVRLSRDEEVVLYESQAFRQKIRRGKDIARELDLSRIRRPNQEQRRISILSEAELSPTIVEVSVAYTKCIDRYAKLINLRRVCAADSYLSEFPVADGV